MDRKSPSRCSANLGLTEETRALILSSTNRLVQFSQVITAARGQCERSVRIQFGYGTGGGHGFFPASYASVLQAEPFSVDGLQRTGLRVYRVAVDLNGEGRVVLELA